jgi:predicted HicB family RNase H-like nuclease
VPRKSEAQEDPVELQSFTARIPVDLHHALRLVAADEDKSLNELLTDILRDWWQKKPDRRRYEDFLRAKR